jgi:hypothetical protein
MGFDPLMEKRHAYLAEKPDSDTAERVPAALLLAVTALAALPLFPTAGRRGFTNALCKDSRWQCICWPLWSAPLALPAAISLLGTFSPEAPPAARLSGAAAAYSSERGAVKSAAGTYYVLRPGRRLW